MTRKMCGTCPFNPYSPLYHLKENWQANLDQEMFTSNYTNDGSVAHTCHEINDDLGTTIDPNIQCIGHLEHIRKYFP